MRAKKEKNPHVTIRRQSDSSIDIPHLIGPFINAIQSSTMSVRLLGVQFLPVPVHNMRGDWKQKLSSKNLTNEKTW